MQLAYIICLLHPWSSRRVISSTARSVECCFHMSWKTKNQISQEQLYIVLSVFQSNPQHTMPQHTHSNTVPTITKKNQSHKKTSPSPQTTWTWSHNNTTKSISLWWPVNSFMKNKKKNQSLHCKSFYFFTLLTKKSLSIKDFNKLKCLYLHRDVQIPFNFDHCHYITT
jgi:hypothetical protein